MKQGLSVVLILFLLFFLFGCSFEPKIYDVPPESVMSATEISELFYYTAFLRDADEVSLPENIAVSLKEPIISPIIFAFFPKEKRLILVTNDLYLVPESDWVSVGTDKVSRAVMMMLEVPYRNTEELLAQDLWYGKVDKICSINYNSDWNIMFSPLLLAFQEDNVPSNPEATGNIYGYYYPAEGEIVRDFSQNPLFPTQRVFRYVGFYVVSEDAVDFDLFKEVLFRYEMFPKE